MDSPQREGTRAWHAHIGLEQSNVARVERADLLVLLVVFVVDDRPTGHVLLPAASASSGGREGAFVPRATSVRCLPHPNTEARAAAPQPDPGAGHCLAILIKLRHIHGCGLVDAQSRQTADRLPDAHSSAGAASARRGLTRGLFQAVAIVILSHVQAFAQP